TLVRLVAFERLQRGTPRLPEAERLLRNAPHLAGESNDVGRCLAALESDVEFELRFGNACRGRLAGNAGPPHDAVQTFVRESHAGVPKDRRELPAGGVAPRASDLEDVGEVDIPATPEGDVDRLEPVVRNADPLIANPIPQELLPRDVDRTARNRDPPVGANGGAGHIAFGILFPEPPVLPTIQRLWVRQRPTWQNAFAGRSPGWPAAKLWEARSRIRPLPMNLRGPPGATSEARRS